MEMRGTKKAMKHLPQENKPTNESIFHRSILVVACIGLCLSFVFMVLYLRFPLFVVNPLLILLLLILTCRRKHKKNNALSSTGPAAMHDPTTTHVSAGKSLSRACAQRQNRTTRQTKTQAVFSEETQSSDQKWKPIFFK